MGVTGSIRAIAYERGELREETGEEGVIPAGAFELPFH
jgi:hypothetical protein